MTTPPAPDRTHPQPPPMFAAVVGGVLAFGAVLAAAVLFLGPPRGRTSPAASVDTPVATASLQAAPADEVQRVHDVLHDIAARCPRASQADADSQRQLDRDVDVILAFAERYPNARFPIDDETGRTLSLLVGTHDDLRTCAPSAATRINQALPSPYQDPVNTPGNPSSTPGR